MEIKKSPLLFHEFIVIDSHLETVFDTKSAKCNFNKIPLSIDFDTFKAHDNNNLFNVALTINGNNIDKPKLGYKYSINAHGIFEITRFKEFEKEEVDRFLLYSALPMLISSVRSYLLNITSYAPYGKYLLPAIDLSDLVKQKVDNDKKTTGKIE
jgi:preprotein translocase subunit SecB